MSKTWVTLPNAGNVRIPLVQALEISRVLGLFVDPVWHLNDCGCCVSVHERRDDTRGYVIGADGGSDWVVGKP